MPMITWDESYSVGVKELDDQHKKIIEIIDRLYLLISENKNIETEIPKILSELAEYADRHFSSEEIYFREFDYDKAESHIQIHNEYRERVKEFRHDFEAGKGGEVLADLSDFVNGWWVWHINHTDKEYTQCFHDHGLY